jgi:HK97 family phage prohead protease
MPEKDKAVGATVPDTVDPQFERRVLAVDEVEFRLVNAKTGKPARLVGYAAVFNKLSEPIMGYFREKIAPGAFSGALARGDDVRALVEHEGGLQTLGRTESGTLTLTENRKGLKAEIELPDTQAGQDVAKLVGRGDLSQMSFGFVATREEWYENKEGDMPIRTVLAVDPLIDVSVVAYPAYPQTEVALRSFEGYRKSRARLIQAKPMPLKLVAPEPKSDKPVGVPVSEGQALVDSFKLIPTQGYGKEQ